MVEKEVIKVVPREVVKEVTKEIVVEVTRGFAGAESRQATAVPAATAVPESTGPGVHPGELVLLGVDFGSERFDDFYATGSEEFHSLLHAFNRTFETSEDGLLKVAPGIFTAWELSRDGLTWTVIIREGVKFHDGRDLTRDDVLWSMLHQIGPEAQHHSHSSSNIGWSKRAVSIEPAGSNQVSYTTKKPATDWLGYTLKLAGGGMSKSAVLPKRDKLYDEKDGEAYDRNPIGAGPMRLVNHVQASSMSFERFDDYYYQPKNGLPSDKRMKFMSLDLRAVPEEATRVAALAAGDGDIGLVSVGARTQLERGGGGIVFAPEGGLLYSYWINCWRNPELPCNDKRFRQSISYAIDKEVLANQLYGPDAFVVKGWSDVTPSTNGYSPELDPFPYDPEKARQLMADAGYPGGQGVPKVIINVAVSGHLPLVPESAQLAADFMKRNLGLDVEVRTVDGPTRNRDINFNTNLDGQMSWSVSECRFDATGYNMYFFGIPRQEGEVARLHADPELATLMQDALNVFNLVEQEKFLRTVAYPRLKDEAWHFTLGYSNTPWGVSSRVLEYSPRPLASYASFLHTVILK